MVDAETKVVLAMSAASAREVAKDFILLYDEMERGEDGEGC